MKVEKEKDVLRDNLQKLRKREHESEDYLAQMAAETTKLNTIINEADKERQRQRKECEIVVNERDILGTQLIRRNEELSLLYERIRIQKSSLQKGEQQYSQRVKEIGALKRRIRELSGEMGGLKGSVANLETLRNEVYQLQRELLQERTKVRHTRYTLRRTARRATPPSATLSATWPHAHMRMAMACSSLAPPAYASTWQVRALSEELENPMNVHRWRKLEGSDPATYELVQKTHMLQKRLIEKSEEVRACADRACANRAAGRKCCALLHVPYTLDVSLLIPHSLCLAPGHGHSLRGCTSQIFARVSSRQVVDKDLLIHHKEKLYVELKNILARQPGPEVAEQLSTYQQSLTERAKQMEQMEAELTMSHTQASEYKFEIARINKELLEVKKKFFEQRKREQAVTEQRRAERAQPTELLVQEARSTLNRFTGGGFNLNMSAA